MGAFWRQWRRSRRCGSCIRACCARNIHSAVGETSKRRGSFETMTVTAAFRLAPLPLTALMLLPVSAPAQEQPLIVTGTGLADKPATPAYDLPLLHRDAPPATPTGRPPATLASAREALGAGKG